MSSTRIQCQTPNLYIFTDKCVRKRGDVLPATCAPGTLQECLLLYQIESHLFIVIQVLLRSGAWLQSFCQAR